MQISFSITADSAEEMDQKLDVALFKLGKNREQILRLAVDEQIEIDQVTIFRSE